MKESIFSKLCWKSWTVSCKSKKVEHTSYHTQSESHSVVSDSLRPHGLFSPWNSPGQNTGVAFPFSRGSSQLRDQTQVSHIAGRFLTLSLYKCVCSTDIILKTDTSLCVCLLTCISHLINICWHNNESLNSSLDAKKTDFRIWPIYPHSRFDNVGLTMSFHSLIDR